MAWLLVESASAAVAVILEDAVLTLSSDLTVLESRRVLTRAVALGEMAPEQAEIARDKLMTTLAVWVLLRCDEAIFDRAGARFPDEPVRTLDALHLACLIRAREAVPDLAVLSLDERIRRNAVALHIPVLPTL